MLFLKPGPMIIPGHGVTMATAPAKSPSLPSQSNPVQIRYDHHTEELNPVRIISQKQRLCDKLAAIRSPLRLQTEADPQNISEDVFKTSRRLQTECLLSVSSEKKERKEKLVA